MANSADSDQTAPIGAVCSWSTGFASILNLSVILGNYLQQTTSADDIFRCILFLGALRVNFFLASGNFCLLLIAFANSLDPDQDRHKVGPDLDPNCLKLCWYS